MQRIYLVQVVDSYGPNKFLPLALGYQWCYAKNNNWHLCDVLIEKIPPEQYIKTMYNPNMVAMSSYIWNWEYNKTLATLIKKHWPECVIVVGGPQVDKHNPLFFEKYPMFDIAVHGEGEYAFKEILTRKQEFDNIPHVQTRTHMPSKAQRLRSVKDIPSPILEGFYEPIMAKYPADTMWQVTYETLRGCPYHCTFCDIGDNYWNKLTLFDIERVKKEIEWMGKNQIEYVSVCDSNWGLLDRDIEITQFVIDTKKKYGYPRWWDATWAKNNVERNFEIALLNKKSRANIFKGITFAMQSFNDDTLAATERFNLNLETVSKYLKKYKQEKIPTYSELIWPMPNETYQTLKKGIQRFIDLGQDDFLMVHPLVITDNAAMGNKSYKEKYQIETMNVPLDTYYLNDSILENYIIEKTDAVISTNTATWKDVINGHMFSWAVITFYYYGWAHYITKYLSKKGIKEIDFFETFLEWIKNNNGLINNEYEQTKQHITNTFFEDRPWGRKVLGDNDILWEYKSATSIVFNKNRNKLKSELIQFLLECYDLPKATELVNLSLAMCKDNINYPLYIDSDKEILNVLFKINNSSVKINHKDKQKMNDNLFFHTAYHWNRKLKYWQCSITSVR